MASKQDNYLRMHHPSIFKKMKKGGKVEDYAKGGKVKYYAYGGRNTDTVPAMLTPGEVVLNQDQQEDLGNMMAGGGKVSEGQAKADALFKHIGVPGFKGGGIAGLFEKGRVFLQDFRHRAGERKAKKKALKEHEKNVAEGREKYTITGIVPPEKKGLEPAVVPSNPPLFPHYGAEGRSSVENLITDSVYGAGESVKRYVGGGLVDKKDALMSYYMGGRVKKKKKKQKRGY